VKACGKRSRCGVNSAIEVLGDKWTLLIVRDMLFAGKQQYGEFLTSGEGIATNILANRLASLEQSGIVEKHESHEGKSRTRYTLTAKGLDLLPIVLELMLWSDRHFQLSDCGKALAKRVRANREETIREIVAKIPR
jgi:DNA-binding HxlR family transcriptional regulator